MEPLDDVRVETDRDPLFGRFDAYCGWTRRHDSDRACVWVCLGTYQKATKSVSSCQREIPCYNEEHTLQDTTANIPCKTTRSGQVFSNFSYAIEMTMGRIRSVGDPLPALA